MNRRVFIVLLLGWTMAALVPATQGGQRGRGHAHAARGPSGTFHGTITRAVSNTIQINVGKESEKVLSFWMDEKTSITGGGKTGTMDDLQAGQTVTVKSSNGRATSVEVEVKPTTKPSDA